MFQNVEEAVQILTDLEREASLARGSASTLATNVEEDRSGLVVPVLIIDPVSLIEGSVVLEVVVIQLLSEIVRSEVLDSHLCILSRTHSGYAGQ